MNLLHQAPPSEKGTMNDLEETLNDLRNSLKSMKEELQRLKSARNSKIPHKLLPSEQSPRPLPSRPISSTSENASLIENIPMTTDEKKKLSNNINTLASENLAMVLQIINERMPNMAQSSAQHCDEIEIDIDALDTATLRHLEKFVRSCTKKRGHSLDPSRSIERMRKTADGTNQKIQALESQIQELSNPKKLSSSTIVSSNTANNKSGVNSNEKQTREKTSPSSSGASSSSGSSSDSSDSSSETDSESSNTSDTEMQHEGKPLNSNFNDFNTHNQNYRNSKVTIGTNSPSTIIKNKELPEQTSSTKSQQKKKIEEKDEKVGKEQKIEKTTYEEKPEKEQEPLSLPRWN